MARTCFVFVAVALAAACSESSRPVGPSGATLRVHAVAPTTGPPSASTQIQITGTGFVDGCSLTLDGVSTPVTFVSSTVLRATALPHPAGPIDVVVTNPRGESSRLTGGFTYADQVTDLRLSGNTSLRAVGETSQLTATADFTDGTTRDVTRESSWTSTMPSVATVGVDGVLTAHSLGATTISVRYTSVATLSRGVQVVVTPPGTYVLSGRVRNPGAGAVSDALVSHDESGQSTRADITGSFSLGGMTGRARLTVSRDGFETVTTEAREGMFVDVPMQRVVNLAAGTTYNSRLAPNDVEYVVDGSTVCQPCRMIRVSGASMVQLKLTGPVGVPLQIWFDGRAYRPVEGSREVLVDVPVGSEGDARVFVGREKPPTPADYISFTLAATASGGNP